MADESRNSRGAAVLARPGGRVRTGQAPASSEVALAGPDGREAAKLLADTLRLGTAALGELTEGAVERLLRRDNPRAVKRLFNDDERAELAETLGATVATAHLLGRARVRERMRGVQAFGGDAEGAPRSRYSLRPTRFARFADAPVRPLPPVAALNYFQSLVPELSGDPKRFGEAMERQAFTLAAATDDILLRKVKVTLADALAGGTSSGIDVALILEAAGVSPRNPQYAEMVYRTNMMDAFNTGASRELQDPDVAEAFPVWRYVGIRDGRQGKDHEPQFDRYYPNSRAFADVRGERVFNCRCSFIPIDKFEWERLQARGARAEE
jgi:hypothetical protein